MLKEIWMVARLGLWVTLYVLSVLFYGALCLLVLVGLVWLFAKVFHLA